MFGMIIGFLLMHNLIFCNHFPNAGFVVQRKHPCFRGRARNYRGSVREKCLYVFSKQGWYSRLVTRRPLLQTLLHETSFVTPFGFNRICLNLCHSDAHLCGHFFVSIKKIGNISRGRPTFLAVRNQWIKMGICSVLCFISESCPWPSFSIFFRTIVAERNTT